MLIKLFFGFLVAAFLPIIALSDELSVAVIDNLDKPVDLAPYIQFIEDVDHSLSYNTLFPVSILLAGFKIQSLYGLPRILEAVIGFEFGCIFLKKYWR